MVTSYFDNMFIFRNIKMSNFETINRFKYQILDWFFQRGNRKKHQPSTKKWQTKNMVVVSIWRGSMTHFKNDLTISMPETCYTEQYKSRVLSMRRQDECSRTFMTNWNVRNSSIKNIFPFLSCIIAKCGLVKFGMCWYIIGNRHME